MHSLQKIGIILTAVSMICGASSIALAQEATSSTSVATTTAAVSTTASTSTSTPIAIAVPTSQPVLQPAPSGIARFSGVISGASTGGFTLTNSKGRAVSIVPSANSTVLIGEQLSSLASLANGMEGGVYGSWAGSTSTISASLITASFANAGGVITNVNGMGFTVTSGTHSVNVTPAGTIIVIVNHAPASVAALTAGMTVSAYGTWTDPTRSTISGTIVIANSAGVGGKVGQVGSGQFVVVNSAGKQITVNTSSATAILKSGAPSAFSSILDGAPISAYGAWTDASESVLNASSVYINGKGSETASNGWCYSFYKNMRVGSQGDDVYNLQVALNQSGFTVPETASYDQSTASAVSGFQQKYASDILTPNGLTYGTGFVGAATRTKLNALFACPNPINTQGDDGQGNGASEYSGW